MDPTGYLCAAAIGSVVSAVIGFVIGSQNRRELEGAIYGFLLGPIGWIIVAIFPMRHIRNCPYCLTGIPQKAVKCRHCGSDLQKPKEQQPGEENQGRVKTWDEQVAESVHPMRQRLVQKSVEQNHQTALRGAGSAGTPSAGPSPKWRVTGIDESGQQVVREIVEDTQEEASAAAILDGLRVRSVKRVR